MGPKDRRRERLDRGIKVRTDGVYAISGWPEISFLLAPRILLILGFAIAPLLLQLAPYWQRVFSHICIYALLALSFDFLAHHVGLVSLGGAFFIGVGGYFTAILNTYFGLPVYISMPGATILGALFCTLVLYPCLPLRGVYFAIVTLMFPLLMSRLIEAFDVFGGTEGIYGLDSLPNVWIEQYILVGGVVIGLFGLRRLLIEDVGLVFKGVKDNDQAVRASGMNISHYKAYGLFIASALGCLGGASLAHNYMWAGISQFALDFSILPIAATVIGGMGTLVGPVLGCVILVPLSEWLRDLGTLRIAVYAVVLMIFIVFKTEGLMVYATRKYHQFEHWVNLE